MRTLLTTGTQRGLAMLGFSSTMEREGLQSSLLHGSLVGNLMGM